MIDLSSCCGAFGRPYGWRLLRVALRAKACDDVAGGVKADPCMNFRLSRRREGRVALQPLSAPPQAALKHASIA